MRRVGKFSRREVLPTGRLAGHAMIAFSGSITVHGVPLSYFVCGLLVFSFGIGLLKIPRCLQYPLVIAAGVVLWDAMGGGPSAIAYVGICVLLCMFGRDVGSRWRQRGRDTVGESDDVDV